jgi:tRNA(adenine34) deaminase
MPAKRPDAPPNPADRHQADLRWIARAIERALAAEAAGNLPVGAVIVLDGRVVAEASNALRVPAYHPGRHAEVEALRQVPIALWPRAAEMTCYTTLEPCLMCFGALLLHGVGRVVFGALDPDGGARFVFDHLPPFYSKRRIPAWVGPVAPDRCDPLFARTLQGFVGLPSCGSSHPTGDI